MPRDISEVAKMIRVRNNIRKGNPRREGSHASAEFPTPALGGRPPGSEANNVSREAIGRRLNIQRGRRS